MMALRLDMDLGDKRAGGVEIEEIAPGRGRQDRFGHPVGREDDRCIGVRYFVQFFYKYGALGFQGFHYVAVMDDLMAHIDWRAIFGERELDDLNGAINASAKSARRPKIDGDRKEVCLGPNLFACASHR